MNKLIELMFSPPFVYYLAGFIITLCIAIYFCRKPICREIKKWYLKGIEFGPLIFERGEKDKNNEHLPEKETENDFKEGSNKIHPIESSTLTSNIPQKLYLDLVGRDIDIESILNTLRNPKGKKTLGIYGFGGVGKSSLAREIMVTAIEQNTFPYAWWTTAKVKSLEARDSLSQDPDKDLSYMLILQRLASWLGIDSEIHVNSKIREIETRIKNILINYRILFVLDNLETSTDQNDIAIKFSELISNTKCRAILTSREDWEDVPIDLFEPYPLEGLSEIDGANFLLSLAKETKNKIVLNASEAQLFQIVRSVKGMPLALKLMVGLLLNHSMTSVLENFEKIQSQKVAKLYEYLFASNWRTLNTEEKEMLIILSKFDEEEGVDSYGLRNGGFVEAGKFDEVIDKLVRISLVEISPGSNIENIRYTLHPLTYNFIRSKIDIRQ